MANKRLSWTVVVGRIGRWLGRFDPTRREVVVANAFLMMLLLVGGYGYKLLEGWTFFDGIYMTFITITTIGFAEVKEMSLAGRTFTIVLALTGIGTVAFIATRTAQIMLSTQNLKQRYFRRMIDQLSDHFIVCGYGRVGMRIAADLRKQEVPFIVIDRDEDVVETLRMDGIMALEGDAQEEETLVEAHIDRAKGVILALPEDSANVFVSLVARECNPDVFILARTNDHRNRRKMLHAGANKVVSPVEIGADRMTQVILRPHVDHFMERLLGTQRDNLSLEEVTVEAGALLDGTTLAQVKFRSHFDAIVVSIVRPSGELQFNPTGTDEIHANDVLIVLGTPDMIAKLAEEGCSTP
ncbi:MAG: potassium channel protein [Bacteroidota bacterium]